VAAQEGNKRIFINRKERIERIEEKQDLSK
jgi:hypothetical protein